jgi:GH25 family lysozyme M1 (1,4-beta-N-acetylmuramidase)
MTTRRRVCAALAAVATTGTIAVHPASASASTPQPTAAARSHGIAAPGEASMGWTRAGGTAAGLGAAPTSVTAATAAPMATAFTARSWVEGVDVSSHQRTVAWSALRARGIRFAYFKATEGRTYRNPYFHSQYGGSYRAGMAHGAYHFAIPNVSSGSTQASIFVAHGGGWSADGRTLPGVLDIEYNPYGSWCYGLSPAQMTRWIRSFTTRYHRLTGRDAVIYTTLTWWRRCTGNTTAFSRSNPLWVATVGGRVGSLPGGWPYQSFWQYSEAGGLDRDRFNGSFSKLTRMVRG